jgi:hypothetical protein
MGQTSIDLFGQYGSAGREGNSARNGRDRPVLQTTRNLRGEYPLVSTTAHLLAATLEAQATALETQAATLRALAREAAKGSPTDLIDQTASPLGNRRHCTAVQKLVAAGKPGASIVGRKHYLTPEALAAELAKGEPRKRAANDTAPRKCTPREPTPLDALDQSLARLAG